MPLGFHADPWDDSEAGARHAEFVDEPAASWAAVQVGISSEIIMGHLPLIADCRRVSIKEEPRDITIVPQDHLV